MKADFSTAKAYWPVGAFFVLLSVILIKLVQSWLPKKKSRHSESYLRDLSRSQDTAAKSGGKKKKGKKQRPTDISPSAKGSVRSDLDTNVLSDLKAKPSTPTLENGDMKVRKAEKKKSKNKKRRSQADEIVDVINNQAAAEAGDGEWHTVGSKEQRVKKDKKKQEVDVAPPSRETSKPVYIPQYSVTSMPSTAKDVAPRFAKAAGEEWNERRPKQNPTPTSTPPQTITRTPLTQAIVPQSKPTTNWLPPMTTPISGMWEAAKGNSPLTSLAKSTSSWINSSPNSAIFSKPADWTDLTNVSTSWHDQVRVVRHPLKANASPSGTAGAKRVEVVGYGVPGRLIELPPARDTCTPRTSSITSQRWAPSQTEDWVHVNSSTAFQPTPLRQWSGIRTGGHASPPDVAQAMMKREEYLLEPEGYSVPPPSALDDPWNPESPSGGAGDAKADLGDWEPPEASWSNAQDQEWETTTNVKSKAPAYVGDSSEDEKSSTANPSVPVQPSSAAQQTVVGAGPELLGNPNANKKQRRRRRKKNPTDAVDAIESEVLEKETSVDEQPQAKQPTQPERVESSGNEIVTEDWSKAGKKKKVRARKDD